MSMFNDTDWTGIEVFESAGTLVIYKYKNQKIEVLGGAYVTRN